MPIHARVMTLARAHWVAALRVASPLCQELARGLNRRPACRYATHKPLAKRGSNVTYPNSINRP